MNNRTEWTADRAGRERHALVVMLDTPCADLSELPEHDSSVPPVGLSDDGLTVTYEIVSGSDAVDGDVLRNDRDSNTGRIQLERGPIARGKVILLTELGYITSA